MPPLGGFLSEYCHNVWCGITRLMYLPDGGKSLRIHLDVLTQYWSVMDRQTDILPQHSLHYAVCIASRANMMFQLGEGLLAMKDYAACLEIQPTNTSALFQCALLHFDERFDYFHSLTLTTSVSETI